jgi:beta-lactamase superfamily II metal-dependent hydrolase
MYGQRQVQRKDSGGSPIVAILLILLIGGLIFVALNFNKVMNYINTGQFVEDTDIKPVDNDQSNSETDNKENDNNSSIPIINPTDNTENDKENKEEPKEDEGFKPLLFYLPFDKIFLNDNPNIEDGYSGPNDSDTVLYISPMSVSIKIDEYYTFKLVSSNDIIGNSVNWNSSNTSIASIDSQGKVKGLKAGTVTITATIGESKKATATLHVINVGLAMSTSSSVKIGENPTISIDNEYKGKVKFVSSNPRIATVDNNGRITTLRTGTVTITGTSGNLMNSVTLTIVGSRIHFINTNDMADAILLESNNKFALIDTGTTSWDTSRKYFFDYLDSLGLKEDGFEFVILTNHHREHDGGMVSLLNKGYPVKKIYMKSYNSKDDHSEIISERYNKIIETAKSHNTSIVYVDKDNKFKEEISKSGTVDLSDMHIYFFNTLQRLDNGNKGTFDYYKSNFYSGESENINSIVNLIRVNGHNILLTSDLNNYDIFNGVMKNKVKMVWNRNEKIDIYKINNHGSFDCTGNTNMEINATNYVVTNKIDQEYTNAKGNGYMITNDKVVYNSKENDSCFSNLGLNMCDAYYVNNSSKALVFNLTKEEIKINGTKGNEVSKRCK